MRIIIRLGLVISLIWGCMQIGMVNSEEKPLTNQSKPDVEKLIQQLDVDDWNIRESVQAELTSTGKKLIDKYRRIKCEIKRKRTDETKELNNCKEEITKFSELLSKASQSKDPEIKSRSKVIQRDLFRLTQCEIAFASKQHTKKDKAFNQAEIYVMDAEGKNIFRLTENNIIDNSSPVWSPDGSKVAFVGTVWKNNNNEREKESESVYIMDADGKNLTKLTECISPRYEITGLSWHPDGTKIAFSGKEGIGEGVYAIDVDGKNHTRLSTKGFGAKWSPDGTKIAYVITEGTWKEKNFKRFIYLMDTDGKNRNQVKLAEGANPQWNPDGTKILFSSKIQNEENYSKSSCGIYSIDTDAKNLKRLTEGKIYAHNPEWSPDGKKISFAVYKDSKNKIYLMDADGKNQTQLTKNGWDLYHTWSPDGSMIAFEQTREL